MGVAVPLHAQLVGPAHHLQAVLVQKLLAYILSPAEPSAPWRRPKALAVIVGWVRPEQVAEGPLVGDVLNPVDGLDLAQLLDFGGEPTVEAEHLVLDNGGEGQVHEDLGEHLPD